MEVYNLNVYEVWVRFKNCLLGIIVFYCVLWELRVGVNFRVCNDVILFFFMSFVIIRVFFVVVMEVDVILFFLYFFGIFVIIVYVFCLGEYIIIFFLWMLYKFFVRVVNEFGFVVILVFVGVYSFLIKF